MWSFLKRKPTVLKQGRAVRVVFFYPGEEGTYVDQPDVTIYETGAVHIKNVQEETTTHLRFCEVIWDYKPGAIQPKPANLSLLIQPHVPK